jgi:hypothetical protein
MWLRDPRRRNVMTTPRIVGIEYGRDEDRDSYNITWTAVFEYVGRDEATYTAGHLQAAVQAIEAFVVSPRGRALCAANGGKIGWREATQAMTPEDWAPFKLRFLHLLPSVAAGQNRARFAPPRERERPLAANEVYEVRTRMGLTEFPATFDSLDRARTAVLDALRQAPYSTRLYRVTNGTPVQLAGDYEALVDWCDANAPQRARALRVAHPGVAPRLPLFRGPLRTVRSSDFILEQTVDKNDLRKRLLERNYNAIRWAISRVIQSLAPAVRHGAITADDIVVALETLTTATVAVDKALTVRFDVAGGDRVLVVDRSWEPPRRAAAPSVPALRGIVEDLTDALRIGQDLVVMIGDERADYRVGEALRVYRASSQHAEAAAEAARILAGGAPRRAMTAEEFRELVGVGV